jgi:hypothetical protein
MPITRTVNGKISNFKQKTVCMEKMCIEDQTTCLSGWCNIKIE